MKRIFQLILWFIVGLSLGGFSVYASAETLAATSTQQYQTICSGTASYAWPYEDTVYPPDWTAVCKAHCGPTCQVVTGQCRNNPWTMTCHLGDRIATVYTCPSGQNWTLSGATCTRPDCPAGTLRDPATGQCIQDCNSATSKANSGQWFEGDGAMPSSLCVNGCTFSASACVGFGGTEWGCLAGAGTGQNCSGAGVSQASAAAKACMEQGQGVGTVNGITVCSGPATTTTSTSTSTTTTTNPNTSTTTTNTTSSSTTCSGDTCTTTTTQTDPNNPGGSPITTTTNSDKGTFCKQNPNDVACKGNTEQDDYCAKNPEALSCMKAGTPGEESNLTSTARGVSSITAASLSTDMSCPQPVALPHNWGVLDPAPICSLADMLRPLVLAFAWLAAGLIVVGGFKDV